VERTWGAWRAQDALRPQKRTEQARGKRFRLAVRVWSGRRESNPHSELRKWLDHGGSTQHGTASDRERLRLAVLGGRLGHELRSLDQRSSLTWWRWSDTLRASRVADAHCWQALTGVANPPCGDGLGTDNFGSGGTRRGHCWLRRPPPYRTRFRCDCAGRWPFVWALRLRRREATVCGSAQLAAILPPCRPRRVLATPSWLGDAVDLERRFDLLTRGSDCTSRLVHAAPRARVDDVCRDRWPACGSLRAVRLTEWL
jgi:hypothetical protein